MTDQALKSQLNRDMYFGIRRREQLAWIVAIIAGLAALLLAAAILVMMPLKTTQAYLGLVDRQSGDVIRAYEVGRATLTERDAVIESWIYNYALDRETHDIHDQQQRLERVISRSVGTARDDLLDLWNPRSPRYIRKLISRDARVFVNINAITLLSDTTAQVRLQKRIVDGTRRRVVELHRHPLMAFQTREHRLRPNDLGKPLRLPGDGLSHRPSIGRIRPCPVSRLSPPLQCSAFVLFAAPAPPKSRLPSVQPTIGSGPSSSPNGRSTGSTRRC